jgi:hypothetical protein
MRVVHSLCVFESHMQEKMLWEQCFLARAVTMYQRRKHVQRNHSTAYGDDTKAAMHQRHHECINHREQHYETVNKGRFSSMPGTFGSQS